MRKSIQLIMALAVIAMVAVSCQKEGQFNPSKKVKKITETITGKKSDGKSFAQTEIKEFVWDGNKLSSLNYYVNGELASITKYTYDSKNRMIQINRGNTSGSSTLVYKYEYDGNKLSSIKEIWNGYDYGTWTVEHSGNLITQMSYKASESKGCNSIAPTADALFFLPDNIIKDINIALKENSTKGFLKTTVYFSWENSNLVGLAYSSGSIGNNVKITYDNNKNPLYGWYDSGFNTVDVMLSKHNITMTSNEVKKDNETQTVKISYKYTYNGSYPATCEYSTIIEVDDEYVDATFKKSFEY